MGDRAFLDDTHDLNEGSWAYVSLPDLEKGEADLRSIVVEACESSGWHAVSSSLPERDGGDLDSARVFERMSHAVGHADVVVVLMDGSSAMTHAELAFAYEHHRPVIGLTFEMGKKDGSSSEAQATLERYAWARLVECVSPDDCASGLREVLTDPDFAVTIRGAAREKADRA